MTNWLLYATAVLIWGSTWFAIEFQLGVVPVEVSLAYRFLAASALLFGWCLVKGLSLAFDIRGHRYFLAMGALLFGLNYLSAYWAQVYISSALNAIVFTAIVWLNIVNSRIFLGTRIESRTYLGALLGMMGIALIFWPEVREVALSDEMLLGATLSITSAVIASFGNVTSALAQRRELPVVQTNAWGMLYGGLLTVGIAISRGDVFAFDPRPGYVISLAYLSVFGSVLAFGAYLTLLGRIGAHRAGYVVVMFPVVALLLSALFEGLHLTTQIVAGVALALAGNLLILGRVATASEIAPASAAPSRRE
jgi:drug/metabolite transporter (DMT)-like permease